MCAGRGWKLWWGKFAQRKSSLRRYERKIQLLSTQIHLTLATFQGTLSANTQRLLKSVLPAGCLWTALRPVEGFKYDETIEELKTIYPPGPGEDVAMDQDDPSYCILPESVPAPIREMAEDKLAIESLGTMIWYLRQLNIDKDILTMKNFNVYDPMKRGMGLTLDGQTLSHLEVGIRLILSFGLLTSIF